MKFEFFTGDVLDLSVSNAGGLPAIFRMGREAEPVPTELVGAFRRLNAGEYAVVGVTPKYGDKRDLEALSAVTTLNRAAAREGLRKDGLIFVLRTIDEGARIAVYVGNDVDRVTELDERAAARAASKS